MSRKKLTQLLLLTLLPYFSGCSKSSGASAENGEPELECKKPITKEEMSLDPDEVHAIIESNLQPLQMCYERVLAMNPALEGQIDVNLVVEPNGTPSMVCSSSTSLASSKVVSCVLRTIARIQFPERDEQVATVYPLSFSPG